MSNSYATNVFSVTSSVFPQKLLQTQQCYLLTFQFHFLPKISAVSLHFVVCEMTEHSDILSFCVYEHSFRIWLIFLLHVQINLNHMWTPNVIYYDITRVFLISVVIVDRKHGSFMTIE